MRRSARKMKLTGNGSRKRNVKDTGPGICVKSRYSGLDFFIFLIILVLESVIPDKCPNRDAQPKRKFCT